MKKCLFILFAMVFLAAACKKILPQPPARLQARQAIEEGDLQKVKTLITKKNVNDFIIAADEKSGVTALTYAAIKNRADIAKYLLSLGADVNLHKGFFTPLFAAA